MPKASRAYTVRFALDKEPHKILPAIFHEWLSAGYIEVIKSKFPRKARICAGYHGWFDEDGNLQIRRDRWRLPIGPRIQIWTAIVMARAIYNERFIALSDLEVARETERQYRPGGQSCEIVVDADFGQTRFDDGALWDKKAA